MTSAERQRIEIVIGDITALEVDAIVNAANEALVPGGGVCGAIHRRAGPALAEACAAIGHCPTGSAVITPGFNLQARSVIHAVGPVWHGGSAGEADLLAGCYRTSLALCATHSVRSVAFPAISTGIFGYPLEAATEVAIRTVLHHLDGATLPARVIFCCFDSATAAIYRGLLDAAS